MTIMPYFSMKWSASSPTACPQMIILVPESAIALMIASSDSSSELE